MNPRRVALDLVGRVVDGARQGGFIGLTSQQAGYVINARKELEALDNAYFSRTLRDKRFDALVMRSIRDGKKLSVADIDRITGRYRDRLLKMRADTIARTESINSMRAGKHEGFKQLLATGKVREDQIERVWDATMDKRTRHDHMVMEGQKVKGLSAPFVAPDGSRMMFPGDTSLGASAANTINCRCVENVKIKYI